MAEKPSEELDGKDSAEKKGNVRELWTKNANKIEKKDSISIDGINLSYRVLAGEQPFYNKKAELKAKFFYTHYKLDSSAQKVRPITFVFNGGPGSSSVWLHLGMMGPKRVVGSDHEDPWNEVFNLEANKYTTLAQSDLVFIDPIGTGFSHSESDKEDKEFFHQDRDIESIGEFIRSFLSENNYWQSPVYIVGESYGGYRGAGLCSYLSGSLGIFPKGALFVAPVIDFYSISFSNVNILPYIHYLPTYAATAWYHKKIGPKYQSKTVEEVHQMAMEFSVGQYSKALLMGNDLEDTERNFLIDELSQLTGIEAKVIAKCNLKIGLEIYATHLLEEERQFVGRLDARFTGFENYFKKFSKGYFDPSNLEIFKRYVPAINYYLREYLEYKNPLSYETLSLDANSSWKYEAENQIADMGENLVEAMKMNQNLKVHIVSGFYDLAVPPEVTKYSIRQMDMPKALLQNFQYHILESGHMIYVKEKCMKDLQQVFSDMYEVNEK